MDEEKNKYRLRELLNWERGYDIALLTTFNFELSFFERALLTGFMANDIRKVSVYVDSAEFAKALSETYSSHIGIRYMANPVKCAGAFHPKMVLLIGDGRAKLYVGSGNVKNSGYMVNNEIFNVVEYDAKNCPETLWIINDAIDLFDKINKRGFGLDADLIEEAKTYFPKGGIPEHTERFFFSTVHTSMITQVKEHMVDGIKEIWIAVPYYDQQMSALKKISVEFPDTHLRVFLQNKNSTFVTGINESEHIVDDIFVFKGFPDGGKNSFYHAKVILFKGNDHDYVLYGSANCTVSALFSDWSQGNLEADLFDIGALGEFDGFFNRMIEDEGAELTTFPLKVETEKIGNYTYHFGEVTKDGLKLHIGYHERIDSTVVKYDDVEYPISYVDDEMIVEMPFYEDKEYTNLFRITLEYNDITEEVVCWTYNKQALDNNRMKQSGRPDLASFDPDGRGDKYREDIERLLREEQMCHPELMDAKKIQAAMVQNQAEKENRVENETDEFVVDFELPDNYHYEYRRINILNGIRKMYLHSFIHSPVQLFLSSSMREKKIGQLENANTDDDAEFRVRKPTSDEILFERYVKRRIKGVLTDDFVKDVEFEQYLSLVAVIYSIFEKYRRVERVDILDDQYVVKTMTDLYLKMLLKMTEIVSDYDDRLRSKCFEMVIDIYQVGLQTDIQDREFFDVQNKNLLKAMENRFGIRERLEDEFGSISALTEVDLSFKEFENYVNRLFGYKTADMIDDVIQKVYPGAVVTRDGKTLLIEASVVNFKGNKRPDTSVLKEISNYSRNAEKTETVRILLDREDQSIDPTKEVTVRIEHRVDMEYIKWSVTRFFSSGKRMSDKTEFIYF